ncbi:hypothetical protein EMCRGX_G028484 [Ephydatia muelleri]|eukprot:Em0020g172a
MAGRFGRGRKGPPINTTPSDKPLPPVIPPDVDSTANITIAGKTVQVSVDDFIEEKELGRGEYGCVYQMRLKGTNTLMAVKRIRSTAEGMKPLLMDLNVSKTLNCPYTITFYGALFTEGDVLICMELMDKSLSQLYKLVYDQLKLRIPEPVLGKMIEAIVKALHFLKSQLKILHRDVKPSNVLINKAGQIKLCDFGIAGQLVNSLCKTNIGCKPYLAPERINPELASDKYGEKSDVWSLGITICELVYGRFPYPPWKTIFEQLKVVVDGEPPRIPSDAGFSDEFRDFVSLCLKKDVQLRPKYDVLLDHPFIKQMEQSTVDVAAWYQDICDREQAQKA